MASIYLHISYTQKSRKGRYSPKGNGKLTSRNVYTTSLEECEEKLAKLIKKMNTKITEMKNSTRQ